ncbi:M20 family metallo-hydrolase [Paenisporosarcina sp. TG20]|uniref:M20 family metallo-hydrolase n=1 Tax=Paenisporosarcina sp. TG20 TaxID=1211706 RepID=UPI0002FFBF76|nr:M20 family metallo-hydrolase [Paenisporosarcina sp. TG20]
MSLQTTLTINKNRLDERINTLSQIGKIGDTGVCRITLSVEDRQAVDTVRKWMEEAGLTVKIDNFGNLIGRLEGRNPEAPILMLGSHIDSQPYGGRFDGVIGVLGALEVVQTMKEQNIVPSMPIEVVSFSDEEGCRFNKGLFGVRGILGKLEDGELERKDKSGITRREALIQFGCDPTQLKESEYPSGSIQAFLEMHIEQGPILEEQGLPVGIVSGISGPLWLTVELEGFAGHAGSVPMPMRKDALVGAAKVIVALNELASQDINAPTVGTVGSMSIFPDSRNIIPEKVSFTVDLRDIDIDRRHKIEKQLRTRINEITEEHQLTCKISEDTNSEPRYCSERIRQIMKTESEQIGLKEFELMSGPFHDALAMSYECEYGMIFVRCKDGISHNPKEFSTYEDISLGTELLYRTALNMGKD